MATCPICKNNVRDYETQCPSCGYRFHETTQEFQPVTFVDKVPAEQHQESSEASLMIRSGRQKGMAFKLTKTPIIVGRSPKCDVFLNDMTVSREHAVLEEVNGTWTIKDKDSFNGVWINNKNIDRTVLHNGDLIQIGCFILKFAS